MTGFPAAPQTRQVLLLGSSGSGKTTVLQQMRFLHGVHPTQPELDGYRQVIFDNVLTALRTIVTAVEELGLELPSQTKHLLNGLRLYISPRYPNEPLHTDCRDLAEQLWVQAGIEDMYAHGNVVGIPEK